MSRLLSLRWAALVAAPVVVLSLAVALFAWKSPPAPEAREDDDDFEDAPAGEDVAGFRERGRESGIDFRMAFLPGEQGEHFKVNLYDHGCGVAVADFDGDGHDDVYFCNQLGKNGLYRNNGDGTFTDVTDRAGVGLGDRVCVAAAWADTRNVGRQDLFVTSTRGGNVLFRNNGDGTFTDVTRQAGLAQDPPTHSQTAVFFDFDGDGFLDLFVTNTARWTIDEYDRASHYYPGQAPFESMLASPKEHNVLYRNKGDGTFEDVTDKVGLKGQGWGGDVVVFDYDGDGWPDLLVTNMFGASQLYHNVPADPKGPSRGRQFVEVGRDVLGKTSWGGIGAKAFDFNNDGRLDLLIVDMHSDMWLPPNLDPRQSRDDLKKKYGSPMGPPSYKLRAPIDPEQYLTERLGLHFDEVVFGNTLYKNLGSGKFEEVSDKAGMETWWPWGVATGDFDNDGFEDVFLPSGMGYPYSYWPSALMMNNGDETFTDRAAPLGIEPPRGGEHGRKIANKRAARSSRCAATADFAGTGRLDLVVNNFNGRAYYFRNHFPQKNYVAFRLEGTRCNRDAIGALLTLHIGKEVMVRQVQAAGGYLSQSSKTLHFGLGDRTRIDRAEIKWPGDPKVQVLDGPEINKLHPVAQPRG